MCRYQMSRSGDQSESDTSEVTEDGPEETPQIGTREGSAEPENVDTTGTVLNVPEATEQVRRDNVRLIRQLEEARKLMEEKIEAEDIRVTQIERRDVEISELRSENIHLQSKNEELNTWTTKTKPSRVTWLG